MTKKEPHWRSGRSATKANPNGERRKDELGREMAPRKKRGRPWDKTP